MVYDGEEERIANRDIRIYFQILLKSKIDLDKSIKIVKNSSFLLHGLIQTHVIEKSCFIN